MFNLKLIHMKKLLLTALAVICTAAVSALTLEDGKTYTISNRNNTSLFVQDNGGDILAMGNLDESSYWVLEATSNADCFYIRNKATGRYVQACDESAEVNVLMGTEPVEYKILAKSVEGDDIFGITSTNLSNTEFTNGCIGWNYKADNTVQTFAAQAGTNHRSFWKMALFEEQDPTDSWPLDGKYFTIRNFSTNAPAYMADNNAEGDVLSCIGTAGDDAVWLFEKTEKENCYYVRNDKTKRYIQAYGATEEVAVTMGETPAEYCVMSFASENGNYGFACTANSPYDFTAGCIGLNLRAESNQEGCCAQTFKAVAGTNHRSFWTLSEQKGYTLIEGAAETAEDAAIYNLGGQQLSKTVKGINIVGGKKVIF